ncbi:MAG: uncharacterized protein JWO56_42 [Acidobacteria bacterium]|nr:uncharacterized protein [Acidobacteriota bacterium]
MRKTDAQALTGLETAYLGIERAAIDVAAMTVVPLLDALSADAAFVAAVSKEGSAIQVARVTPFSQAPVRLAFPIDSAYPIAIVLRNGEALFVSSNEQASCDHPGLVRVRDEDHACATIPLFTSAGTMVGALNVGFADPHEFSDDERTMLSQMAERCAAVLADPPPASDAA